MYASVRKVIEGIAASEKDMSIAEKRDLWAILTALRGPDADADDSSRLKWATTARLRAATLRYLASDVGAVVEWAEQDVDVAIVAARIMNAVDSYEHSENDTGLAEGGTYHFYAHMRNAATALARETPEASAAEGESA
jgi:hypothetical protein